MQPGETIKPHSKPDKDASETSASHEDPKTTKPPLPAETEAQSPWQYTANSDGAASQPPAPSTEPINWSASEFVDHEKNSSWFITLAGITGAALVVIYLITQDKVTVFVVLLAAILFGVTAKRKPRTLKYQLDQNGVQIGDKNYPYETFKSFSVIEEGAFNSIQLMPLKRFMPPISLYYPPESEVQITQTLGSYLPHEERRHDPVDRLMKRIRF